MARLPNTVTPSGLSCTNVLHRQSAVVTHVRRTSLIRAQTIERGPTRGWSTERTWERVLRYPGGQERLIRYPAAQLQDEEDDAWGSSDTLEKQSEWWGVTRYYELSSDEDDDIAQRSLTENSTSSSGRNHEIASPSQRGKVSQGLPSSPAELLRYISSDEYKAAQAEQQRLVRSSYKILEHSPWLQSKPLYLLAQQRKGEEAAATYTLRTRVQRLETEDELSKVLGRRRADGSSLIRVEELRDGIIAFEDEADAHRYASMLEADNIEAMTMECDGHEVFRESLNARAVVVLINKCSGLECHLPLPEELGPALRGQRSLEDPSQL